MYQTCKTYVTENLEISNLIIENPRLLLLLEYFEIDCALNKIRELFFENLLFLFYTHENT